MSTRRSRAVRAGSALAAIVAAPLMLGGCAAMGPAVAIEPSVPVQPGPARAAAFAADRRACMAATDRQVQPMADRLRAAAMAGVPQPAPVTAQVQVLYDQDYGPCMAGRGHLVAAAARPRPGPSLSSGTVTYTGLTDPDSVAARQTLAATIDGFRRDCDGERIEVSTLEAVLSPSSNARSVTLTTPAGGSCFGQPGRNDYLVAKIGSGWRTLLSAEPGTIHALQTRHAGYVDMEVSSLGLCVYTYQWNGRRYTQTGSHDCATAAPPTMRTLPRAIRN